MTSLLMPTKNEDGYLETPDLAVYEIKEGGVVLIGFEDSNITFNPDL
jgi:hypothetical protein